MRDEKRIYIVDDNVKARTSLTLFLSTMGFTARPSSGGVAFLADVDDLRPGCVLLNVRMPDFDGIEVIDALGDRIDRFPVVVVAGQGDVATAVRAMKLGASDFLEKPFAKDVLLETVDRVLETLEARLTASNERTSACTRIEALTRREHDALAGSPADCQTKRLPVAST